MTIQEAKDSVAINQGFQSWGSMMEGLCNRQDEDAAEDGYDTCEYTDTNEVDEMVDKAMELFAEDQSEAKVERLKKDLEYADDKNDDLKDEIRQLEREIEKLEEQLEE